MTILAGHLLGDILLQNRWLAKCKQQSILGLLLHVSIYAFSVCLFTGWWDLRGVLVWVAHLLVDGIGIGKKVWPDFVDMGDPSNLAPAPMWLRLFSDQAWHVVTLALIGEMGGVELL